MMRTGLILLAALGAGCVDWFTEPPPPPTPEDAYLVWTAADGGIQTTWLDASGAAISDHDGLTVASGGTLWQLASIPKPARVIDCGCLLERDEPFSEDAPPAACMTEQMLPHTALAASDGRSVPLLTPALDPWTGDPSFGLDVLGTVGPYLLLVTSTSGYPCGAAHGFHASSFSVVDLTEPDKGAQPIDALLDQAELATLAPDAAEEARAALLKGEGGLDGLMEPDAPLSLTALIADWSAAGLSLSVQLTGEACYACSDGKWSAYTRSHRLSLPQLPARLAPHSGPPPAPVLAWRAANPAARWGFSVLHATPDALAAARSQLSQLSGEGG